MMPREEDFGSWYIQGSFVRRFGFIGWNVSRTPVKFFIHFHHKKNAADFHGLPRTWCHGLPWISNNIFIVFTGFRGNETVREIPWISIANRRPV